MTWMITVDILAGTCIEDAAKIICDIAKAYNAEVKANFNGVFLYAEPSSTPEEVIADYNNWTLIRKEEENED